MASPEFASANGFVARCYFGLFNNNSTMAFDDPAYRLPDYDGQRYWAGLMRDAVTSGASTLEAKLNVIGGFTASPEWQDRLGIMTDEEFVEFLYQHLLGRPSDPGGYLFQLDQLRSGAASRVRLIHDFLSEELNQLHVQKAGRRESVGAQ